MKKYLYLLAITLGAFQGFSLQALPDEIIKEINKTLEIFRNSKNTSDLANMTSVLKQIKPDTIIENDLPLLNKVIRLLIIYSDEKQCPKQEHLKQVHSGLEILATAIVERKVTTIQDCMTSLKISNILSEQGKDVSDLQSKVATLLFKYKGATREHLEIALNAFNVLSQKGKEVSALQEGVKKRLKTGNFEITQHNVKVLPYTETSPTDTPQKGDVFIYLTHEGLWVRGLKFFIAKCPSGSEVKIYQNFNSSGPHGTDIFRDLKENKEDIKERDKKFLINFLLLEKYIEPILSEKMGNQYYEEGTKLFKEEKKSFNKELEKEKSKKEVKEWKSIDKIYALLEKEKYEKPIDYFKKAVAYENIQAMLELAHIYHTYKQDAMQSLKYYRMLQDNKYLYLKCNERWKLEEEVTEHLQTQEQIASSFLDMEKSGDKGKQWLYVGWQFETGTNALQNNEQAFKFYEGAAKLGNREGMRKAAFCLAHGEGVAQDIAAATKYYEKIFSETNSDNDWEILAAFYEAKESRSSPRKGLGKICLFPKKKEALVKFDAEGLVSLNRELFEKLRKIAELYRDGKEFKKDVLKAQRLFTDLAQKGDYISLKASLHLLSQKNSERDMESKGIQGAALSKQLTEYRTQAENFFKKLRDFYKERLSLLGKKEILTEKNTLSRKLCNSLGKKWVKEESQLLADEIDVRILDESLKKTTESKHCFIPLSSEQATFLNQEDKDNVPLYARYAGLNLYKLKNDSYLTVGKTNVYLCDGIMNILNRPISPTFKEEAIENAKILLNGARENIYEMLKLRGKQKKIEDLDDCLGSIHFW